MEDTLVYERPFVPSGVQEYVGDLLNYDKLQRLIKIGPKGTGKTLAVFRYAQEQNWPLLVVDCSEDMGYSHLVGTFGAKGRDVYFSLGVIPAIVQNARDLTGKQKMIVLFEEINALTPGSQKQLNGLLDIKAGVTVKELGQRFSLNGLKDRVIIVGTMNPSFYGGVYSLNEDLKSRFCIMKFGYPKKEQEKKILSLYCDEEKTIDRLITLAENTRSTTFVYQLSPRDLADALGVYTRYGRGPDGLLMMLKVLAGKFDEDDFKTFNERVKGIFGVTPHDIDEIKVA